MPTMTDKKLFRQIYNLCKKTEIKPPARNVILVCLRPTLKTIGLGSLGTKLLGDARSQVLSIKINFC